MFDIPNTKIFMDSVHGYINIPKCFVEHLIDTEVFQRLRNIDQTGMKVLYPNAKHDRFSHSLGVFHLGMKAVDALLNNFSKDNYWNISSDSNRVLFWAKNKLLFLIACLLHDIGHAPFSHATEAIVLRNSNDEKLLSKKLAEKLNEIENYGENISQIKSAPHEKTGALFIIENLFDNISKVYDDLILAQYPVIDMNNILYAEHYTYNPIIDKEDLPKDICFIARMILGLKYEGYEPEKQIRNCFIELLNSSNFDVDKLDYVIRDTKMSGISNVGIDIDRLLDAVCIVTKTKYIDEVQIATKCVIPKLKGNENSNLRINGNIGVTLVFMDKAEVSVEQGSKILSLATTENAEIRYPELAEAAKFSESTVIIQNGREHTRVSGPRKLKTLGDNNGEAFTCTIKNAEIMSEDFRFAVQATSGSTVELQVRGVCNISIKGSFRIKGPLSCFESTEIEGNIQELVSIGNYIDAQVPTEKAYNEFSVGFKKQAINVIANVLEARDYLYLWIYAHHKVIYYANFLLPVISNKVLRDSERTKFPPWGLKFKDLLYLDDCYVWTAIKYCYYTSAHKTEWENISGELLNRKYKNSLYKSLAEYDLLFEKFHINERMMIKQYLIEHCRKDLPYVGEESISAGYLNEEVLDLIKTKEGLDNLVSIVYVDASYTTKKIDFNETFIEMGEGNVVSIGEIPLLSGRNSKATDTKHYFYLYYDTTTVGIAEKRKERELLRNAMKDVFLEVVGGKE